MYVETSKAAFSHYSTPSSYQHGVDLSAFFSALKRRRAPLLLWIAACVATSIAYILVTPAEYTAYTQILLETPKRPHLLLDADGEAYPIDSAQADSRIQVIKSERLLRFVFDTLHLGTRPTRPAGRPSIFSFLPQQSSATINKDTPAFLDFMDHLSVRRIGLSYVVEVAYHANNANAAARTANSITSAYIRDLVISTPNDSQVLQRRISSVAHDADILLAAVRDGSVPNTPIVGIDARVIGTAIVPLHKSSPHTMLILVFALIIGLLTGIGTIFFLHNHDRTIRSIAQARRLFGQDLLAVLHRSSSHARLRKDAELIIQTLPARKGHLRLGVGAARGATLPAFVASAIANRLAVDTPTSLILTNRKTARADVAAAIPMNGSGPSVIDLAAGHSSLVEIRGHIDSRQRVGKVVIGLPGLDFAALTLGISKGLDAVVLVVQQDDTTRDELDLASTMLQAAKIGFVGFVYVVPAAKKSSLYQEVKSLFLMVSCRVTQPLLSLRLFSRS